MEHIVVDILPKTAEDCPYSKYWQMTNKYECLFKRGKTGELPIYVGRR